MRSIRQILKEKDLVIGLSIWHTCSPWLAKIYVDAGADFVFADNEHILFNGADFASFAYSCQLLGLPMIAKCPYMDRGYITRLLDSGVNGIQLPMTESADQIALFAQWMKFPPSAYERPVRGSQTAVMKPSTAENGWNGRMRRPR